MRCGEPITSLGPGIGGSDLSRIGEGLTWLHIADWQGGDPPDCGETTALLTHFADLRGTEEDVCDSTCGSVWRTTPSSCSAPAIGRGFLGSCSNSLLGLTMVAAHERMIFQSAAMKGSGGPTLRRVGKSGRLISCFVPAELGDPAVCLSFTSNQRAGCCGLCSGKQLGLKGNTGESRPPLKFFRETGFRTSAVVRCSSANGSMRARHPWASTGTRNAAG